MRMHLFVHNKITDGVTADRRVSAYCRVMQKIALVKRMLQLDAF
jgi:hypothetical protein